MQESNSHRKRDATCPANVQGVRWILDWECQPDNSIRRAGPLTDSGAEHGDLLAWRVYSRQGKEGNNGKQEDDEPRYQLISGMTRVCTVDVSLTYPHGPAETDSWK
jgi:hypothetical protein